MTAPTVDPPPSGPPAEPSTRPLVVDLAYGDVTIGIGAGPDVRALLDGIDAEQLVTGTALVPAEQRWAEFFATATRSAGRRPLLVGYPSAWGTVRSGVLRRASRAVSGQVTFEPRAVLIARSHADVTVTRCVVIETTHLPTYLAATRPDAPHRRRWDVQRLRRGPHGWEIERSGVLVTVGCEHTDAAAVDAVLDDRVEAVYVDGGDQTEVASAVELIAEHAVIGRVVGVDRRLIGRWGAATTATGARDPAPGPAGATPAALVSPADPAGHHASRHRWWWASGAVLALTVIVTAMLVGLVQREPPVAPESGPVTVGRTTLTVPADWHRADPPAPGTASPPPTQSRTVFVAPDDGARILLVQSPVRAGSTQASVASSLRNRIGQRGDDVVSEFSPSTRFAGRDVISYREAPVSGAPIRWYVLVDHDLQVSIGCQTGTGGVPVDPACADAVAHARIVRR